MDILAFIITAPATDQPTVSPPQTPSKEPFPRHDGRVSHIPAFLAEGGNPQTQSTYAEGRWPQRR